MMKAIFTLLGLLLALDANAAETLGRLFTTPNERAVLNQVRLSKKEMVPQVPVVNQQEISELETPSPLLIPESLAVQGYVKRSDGKKSTVWINGNPMQEASSNNDLVVGKITKKGHQVPVRIKATGKVLALKPGQIYEPESNKVREIRASAIGDINATSPSDGVIEGR